MYRTLRDSSNLFLSRTIEIFQSSKHTINTLSAETIFSEHIPTMVHGVEFGKYTKYVKLCIYLFSFLKTERLIMKFIRYHDKCR